ncbi:Palmitoyltransferase PFA4 [Zancudomyces culisetae]|uniref:Palmitoyltransferase n=1 Tax=Zancudomyces culisetae TaxID=1213189 RepID=A0A1R1PLX0_ZANCU|nr:Palmitoyltransferase PFA4 [Zancudomyces culisetae]|eukprot:OMH81937.1 Palmitoyltransferase PFA4 [Zancudomyces culisetae]
MAGYIVITSGQLYVIGVTAYILYIAITSQYYVFWDYLEPKSRFQFQGQSDNANATDSRTFVLSAFNIIIGLILLYYYLACTVDPGQIPDVNSYQYKKTENDQTSEQCNVTTKTVVATAIQTNTTNDTDLKHRHSENAKMAPPAQESNYMRNTNGNNRYCRTCDVHKPPRAHHCKVCGKCVLKMDHHLLIHAFNATVVLLGPWTNNCVGYYNQAHFYKFLIFVDLGCVFALTLHFLRIFEIYKMVRYPYDYIHVNFTTTKEMFFIVTNVLMILLTIMFAGMLSVFHTFLISRNTTTIENSEISRMEKLVEAGSNAVWPPPIYYVEYSKKVSYSSSSLPSSIHSTSLINANSNGNRYIDNGERIVSSNEKFVTVSFIDDDGERVLRTFTRKRWLETRNKFLSLDAVHSENGNVTQQLGECTSDIDSELSTVNTNSLTNRHGADGEFFERNVNDSDGDSDSSIDAGF